MESQTQKPPWKQIEWYKPPPRITQADLCETPSAETDQEEYFLAEVDSLKEQIQPYDKTELWDLAKRITNPYELISTFSNRLHLPKSTCCIHPLSRSFFKMIEILYHLQFFERHKNPKYKSMHICEGPGGFIEAFHSMAESKQKRVQASYGMTLKSTHTMIPGWRRAAAFLQRHTTVSILYGPSKTGNIYEPENQEACLQSVGSLGAHLVTADGGFDFSDDFINQEKNILRLLINSAIILLECVAHEGDIVLKVFDCNLRVTRDLISLLASCFQGWTLYKPVTSRPCNSEWYFLGRSAHLDRRVVIGYLKQIRDRMSENPDIELKRFLHVNPLDTFLKGLQDIRCKKQVDALKEVITFCKEHTTIDLPALWESNRDKTIRWCLEFRMPTEYKLKY
jgi:23S rRNA U2552 (ribose-2'-O)-methylase RlmE/FtsJ